jgi:hypothetical protein
MEVGVGDGRVVHSPHQEKVIESVFFVEEKAQEKTRQKAREMYRSGNQEKVVNLTIEDQ